MNARTELPRVSLHGTRVVIVDDEREVREVLWRTLTDCGEQVVAAASATVDVRELAITVARLAGQLPPSGGRR